LIQSAGLGVIGLKALDVLFRQPIVNVKFVADAAGASFVTANRLVERLKGLGLLQETTGRVRNRRYSYEPYLLLLSEHDGGAGGLDDSASQITGGVG